MFDNFIHTPSHLCPTSLVSVIGHSGVPKFMKRVKTMFDIIIEKAYLSGRRPGSYENGYDAAMSLLEGEKYTRIRDKMKSKNNN